MADLVGVPGGAQVWKAGDRFYIAYRIPNSDSWMIWRAEEDWLRGRTADRDLPRPDRTFSTRDDLIYGGIAVGMGTADRIQGVAEHPFRRFMQDLDTEAQIRPWLRDPEVLQLYFRAIVEGREVTPGELQGTEWFRSRNESQRAWAELVAADPSEARRQVDDNRYRVQQMFVEMGYPDPPRSLTDYYADRLTHGTISEERLRDRIIHETDPTAPNASPFAGRHLPRGTQVVTDGEEFWIRGPDGDYRLSGSGQRLRYGGDAIQIQRGSINEVGTADQFFTRVERGTIDPQDVEPPRFVVDNLGEHFVIHNGIRYHATGSGAIAALTALYGAPEEVEPGFLTPFGRGPNAVELFGGPNEIERVVAGHAPDPLTGRRTPNPQVITAGDGTTYDPADAPPFLDEHDVSGLGGVEDVRRLVEHWVGPHAESYDIPWFEEWAGRIRRNPNSRDQLVDTLRNQAQALLPNHEPGTSWTDAAQPWIGQAARFFGGPPDQREGWFQKLVQNNDPVWAETFLREQGLERGWQPTVGDFVSGLAQGFGTGPIPVRRGF